MLLAETVTGVCGSVTDRHPAYLLLAADLFDMVKHIYDVTDPARGFLDLRRQADAAHCRRLHAVAHEGL